MTLFSAFLLLLALPLQAAAQSGAIMVVSDPPATAAAAAPEADAAVALRILPAAKADLDALKWVSRPVIVFADTPADPRFTKQMDLLSERPGPLAERDVVVITDTNPAARSAVRAKLHPDGFMLVLIAKDGTVNLRKPFPWDVRELINAIDKMPMRQDELHPQ